MRVLRWEPLTRRTHSGKYWSVQPVMGSEAARSPSAMSFSFHASSEISRARLHPRAEARGQR
jgi:hypothetical protein